MTFALVLMQVRGMHPVGHSFPKSSTTVSVQCFGKSAPLFRLWQLATAVCVSLSQPSSSRGTDSRSTTRKSLFPELAYEYDLRSSLTLVKSCAIPSHCNRLVLWHPITKTIPPNSPGLVDTVLFCPVDLHFQLKVLFFDLQRYPVIGLPNTLIVACNVG